MLCSYFFAFLQIVRLLLDYRFRWKVIALLEGSWVWFFFNKLIGFLLIEWLVVAFQCDVVLECIGKLLNIISGCALLIHRITLDILLLFFQILN